MTINFCVHCDQVCFSPEALCADCLLEIEMIEANEGYDFDELE